MRLGKFTSGESKYPLFWGDEAAIAAIELICYSPPPPYFMRLFAKPFRDYRSRMDPCAARRDIVKPADSAILYSSTRFLHAYTRRRVEITSREGSSEQNKVRSCVYSSPTSVADEIRTVFHSTQTRTHTPVRRGSRRGETDETDKRTLQTRETVSKRRGALPNKWARRNILTYALRIGGS